MRDHGGNIDDALRAHGGAAAEWCDLSTGINPVPYPLPPIPPRAWAALPTRAETAALAATAAAAYRSAVPAVPLAGAQAAIQLVPRLAPPGPAAVLSPTYNEHAAALRTAGRAVTEPSETEALAGAAIATVVNPNNPDGRRHAPDALLTLARRVGLLVVDESFADPDPDLSLAPHLGAADNVVVLRSFGKFYGLAGLRLGFALAPPALADRLAALAGPWAVSGPAIAIGRAALADTRWREGTVARLTADAARLDALAAAAGWAFTGGTPLFRCYETPDAAAVQDRLAQHRVWSRIFPGAPGRLRLGLPAPADWPRLEAALAP